MSISQLCDCNRTLPELFDVNECIGEGRFSKVYAGLDKGSGEAVALKELDRAEFEEDAAALEMLEAEVFTLRRAAGAPHVVKLHRVVESPDAIWLAMERVPGRELFSVLEERGALPDAFVRPLMEQLLTALAALADLGVVHRDVKPENMMVSAEESGAPVLTLIDFGYAALLGEGSEGAQELTGVAGSPEYAAPEVLSWVAVDADETGTAVGEPYDASCDVWGATSHSALLRFANLVLVVR